MQNEYEMKFLPAASGKVDLRENSELARYSRLNYVFAHLVPNYETLITDFRTDQRGLSVMHLILTEAALSIECGCKAIEELVSKSRGKSMELARVEASTLAANLRDLQLLVKRDLGHVSHVIERVNQANAGGSSSH